MIPLLLLIVAFVFAFLRPGGATMIAVLASAFWFEWELPIGVRLGLFEVLFLGGLCGLLAGNLGAHQRCVVPCTMMVIAFSVLSVLSSFCAHETGLARHVWAAFKPSVFASSFFLFYTTLRDREVLKKALLLFFVSATICALIGLGQVFGHRPLGIFFTGTYKADLDSYFDVNDYGRLRAFSSLQHSTVFGAFMIYPITLLGTMMLASPNWRRSKLAWLAICVQVLALLASFSRGAWVGMFSSGLAVLCLLGIHRHRQFWVFAISLIVLSATAAAMKVVPASFLERMETLKDAKNDTAMVPRYERWSYFFDRSLQRPLLGYGTVADEAALEELGTAVSPHNTFIFLAVQRGWAATAVMTALLIVSWMRAWAALRVAAKEELKALAAGLLAGAVGTYAVAGMFTTLWEDFQSSVVFWLFLAVTLRVHEEAMKPISALQLGGSGAEGPPIAAENIASV